MSLISVEADGGAFLTETRGGRIHSSRLAALCDIVVSSLLRDEYAGTAYTCGHLIFSEGLALQAFAIVELGITYAKAYTVLERLQRMLDEGSTAGELARELQAWGLFPRVESAIGALLQVPATQGDQRLGYASATPDVLDLGYADPVSGRPPVVLSHERAKAFGAYLTTSLYANMLDARGEFGPYGRRRDSDRLWDKDNWERIMVRIGVINKTASPSSEDQQDIAAKFNGSFGRDPDGELYAVEAPKVDVLFGGQLAYEGIDLQTRTCAIHHLDLPWEPATYTQRNGRAVRQGSLLDQVDIHAYLTNGSVDFYRLGRMEGRRQWLESALQPGRASVMLGGTTEEEQIDLIVKCTLVEAQPAVRARLEKRLRLLREGEVIAKKHGILGKIQALIATTKALLELLPAFVDAEIPRAMREKLTEHNALISDLGGIMQDAGFLFPWYPALRDALMVKANVVVVAEGDTEYPNQRVGATLLLAVPKGTMATLVQPNDTLVPPLIPGGLYLTTAYDAGFWMGRGAEPVVRQFDRGTPDERSLIVGWRPGDPDAIKGEGEGGLYDWFGTPDEDQRVEAMRKPSDPRKGQGPGLAVRALIANYDPKDPAMTASLTPEEKKRILRVVDPVTAYVINRSYATDNASYGPRRGGYWRGLSYDTRDWSSREGLEIPDGACWLRYAPEVWVASHAPLLRTLLASDVGLERYRNVPLFYQNTAQIRVLTKSNTVVRRDVLVMRTFGWALFLVEWLNWPKALTQEAPLPDLEAAKAAKGDTVADVDPYLWDRITIHPNGFTVAGVYEGGVEYEIGSGPPPDLRVFRTWNDVATLGDYKYPAEVTTKKVRVKGTGDGAEEGTESPENPEGPEAVQLDLGEQAAEKAPEKAPKVPAQYVEQEVVTYRAIKGDNLCLPILPTLDEWSVFLRGVRETPSTSGAGKELIADCAAGWFGMPLNLPLVVAGSPREQAHAAARQDAQRQKWAKDVIRASELQPGDVVKWGNYPYRVDSAQLGRVQGVAEMQIMWTEVEWIVPPGGVQGAWIDRGRGQERAAFPLNVSLQRAEAPKGKILFDVGPWTTWKETTWGELVAGHPAGKVVRFESAKSASGWSRARKIRASPNEPQHHGDGTWNVRMHNKVGEPFFRDAVSDDMKVSVAIDGFQPKGAAAAAHPDGFVVDPNWTYSGEPWATWRGQPLGLVLSIHGKHWRIGSVSGQGDTMQARMYSPEGAVGVFAFDPADTINVALKPDGSIVRI